VRRGALLLFALLIAAAAARAGGAPVAYRLDPESRFDVKTKTAGLLGGLAHEHVIRARAPAGAIAFDAGAPAACAVAVTVDARTLEVTDREISEKDRAEITATLRGPEVLDVAHFPEIRFASTRVRGIFPALSLEGELTLHGKTRAVEVPITVQPEDGGARIRARGSFRVKTSDFGIAPYSAGLGTIQVKDEVEFDFDAVGVREGG
jgi:polyisoprenoid-binding protein YceI